MISLDPDEAEIKKILVCQLRQIGDVILTTPALELLHRRFPQAEIQVFTELKCAPVLENNPHVSRVWGLDKRALPNLFKEIKYYRTIAAEGFDLVVDFQQLPRCRWVVGFSGAKYRLTYPHRKTQLYKWPIYNIRVPQDSGYAVKEKVSILAPLNISWQGEKPSLYLSQEEQKSVAGLLADAGLAPHEPLITVAPTHMRHVRRWPAKYFAKLLDMVVEQDPGFKFLLLYGPGEEDTIAEVMESFAYPDKLINIPRMLSLREMFAAIERAVLHVGNCSAPRHAAVAFNTPSLTIHGASSLDWTYPSFEHQDVSARLPCQPCSKNTCDNEVRCLTELLPETVFITLRDMLPPPVVPLEI